MSLNEKQIKAVISLPGPKRYLHFIKTIAEHEEVWGLYYDGWALAATDSGQQVFPLWPAAEYAAMCVVGEWCEYEPMVISLDDLLDELLPNLRDDHVLPGIFPTPDDKGITPKVDEFIQDILQKSERYE